MFYKIYTKGIWNIHLCITQRPFHILQQLFISGAGELAEQWPALVPAEDEGLICSMYSIGQIHHLGSRGSYPLF